MSSLQTLFGTAGAGVGIKKVQTEEYTIPTINTTEATTDITIETADPQKSIVYIEDIGDGANLTAGVVGHLTTPTNLRLTHRAPSTRTNWKIRYYVIEYEAGAVLGTSVKSIQSDIETVASGSATDLSVDVTINAVDVTKCAVLLNGKYKSFGGLAPCTFELVDSTTLRLNYRRHVTYQQELQWQVIEYDNPAVLGTNVKKVQRGVEVIDIPAQASNPNTFDITIDSVNTDKCQIVLDRRPYDNNVIVDQWGATASFVDSETLRLTVSTSNNSGQTNAGYVGWQVVEYDETAVVDGSVKQVLRGVESVTNATSGTQAYVDVTIPTVSTVKSMVKVDALYSNGSAESASSSATGELINNTTLRIHYFNASNSNANMELYWQVVEYADAQLIGANVKQVQSGVEEFSSVTAGANTYADVTIPAVDTGKSAILVDAIFQGSSINRNPGVSGEFINATTLRIHVNNTMSSAYDIDVHWQVVEYADPAVLGTNVKQVQRGVEAVTGVAGYSRSSVDVSISSVNTNKTFVLAKAKYDSGTSLTLVPKVTPELVDDTTLRLYYQNPDGSSRDMSFVWQVIEYSDPQVIGANVKLVQRGVEEVSLTGGATQNWDITISPVDVGKCEVILDKQVDTNSRYNNYVGMTSELINATTLRVTTRETSTNSYDLNIGWQVVEYADPAVLGANVKQVIRDVKTITPSATSYATYNETLSSAVDPSKSFLLIKDGYHSGGTNLNVTQNYDISGEIINGTTVQFRVRNTLGTAYEINIPWEIVEYDDAHVLGANVKSVQADVETVAAGGSGSQTTDVTISAVNPAKCYVDVAGKFTTTSSVPPVYAKLIDSTTLRIYYYANSTHAQEFSWQVVEYGDPKLLTAGVKSVQTGTQTGVSVTTTKSFTDVTITQVDDVANCSVKVYPPMNSSTGQTFAYGELTSTTNLRLWHQAPGSYTGDIHWEVTEYEAAGNAGGVKSYQEGTGTLSVTTSESTTNVTVSSVSDYTKCKCDINILSDGGQNGDATTAFAVMTSSTNMQITHRATGTRTNKYQYQITEYA